MGYLLGSEPSDDEDIDDGLLPHGEDEDDRLLLFLLLKAAVVVGVLLL